MSKITLSGNPSGTGTFTIASPSGNTDRTLTLPDATGTVVTADGSGNIATTSITPSSGIYLGGSGSANLLDDYEEGTWTPSITFGGNSVGVVYNGRNGYYTKVGNLVFYVVSITLSSKGSSTGDAYVTGLPFTASSATALFPTGNLRSVLAMTITAPIYAAVINGTTTVGLLDNSGGTQVFLTNSDFANNSEFTVTGYYFV